MQDIFDTLILGAGAAGLFCARQTGRRGRRTLVVDHAAKPAEKIRISGGGRCNFTNMNTTAKNFLSDNPHFAKSALARYTPWDFCDLMASHDLTWQEKTLGQLFCDQRSGAVIDMLLNELRAAGAELQLETEIGEITHADGLFTVMLNGAPVQARSLVVATGGLSIPKMGATGLAYDIARQFGHDIITPRPALVPLTFSGQIKDAFEALSGVAIDVTASAARGPAFDEALLFTHRGLSGPAILQISSHWRESEPVTIGVRLHEDAATALTDLKAKAGKKTVANALGEVLPRRFADMFAFWDGMPGDKRMCDLTRADLDAYTDLLNSWQFVPTGTEGWRTAEVTAGGISTRDISSQTMESRHVDGLYFIGECVDVTGWLGGYNFQWAWASAAAAGTDA